MKKQFAFCLVLSIIAVMPAFAREPNWWRMDQSMLPAKLRSLTFEANVFDVQHDICWGKWCVNFDPSMPPVATYVPNGYGRNGAAFAQIKIANLICRNDIAGSSPCTMVLDNVGTCFIQPMVFGIRCPQDVQLE